MIGLCGISRSRADTVVFDFQQIRCIQVLIRNISPTISSNHAMKVFRKCLDEAISQSLRHDFIVVIMFSLVLLHKLIAAKACDSEHAEMILVSCRSNEIGLTEVRVFVLFFCLLTQHAVGSDRCARSAAFLVLVNVNVLAIITAICGEKADHSLQIHALIGNDLLHQCLRVVEKLLRFATDSLIIENLRVSAVGVATTKLPCLKERIPVNVWNNVLDGHVIDNIHSKLVRGRGRWNCIKINHKFLFLCLFVSEEIAIFKASIVILTHLLVFFSQVLNKFFLIVTK
mmetsp:Transcript_11793/g.17768  ORF Transcript_11793/g.17768 Transcript_11793/m.17768 type:complete len:285 (+) Transcript_11793:450-1304(+)